MIDAYYRSSAWRYNSRIYRGLVRVEEDESFMADLPEKERCIALQIYDKLFEMIYSKESEPKILSMKDDVGYHQLLNCMLGYLKKHKDLEMEVVDHTGKPAKVRIVFENIKGWEDYENASHLFNGFSKTIKLIELVDQETGKGKELEGCTEKFKGVAFTGLGIYGDCQRYLSMYEMTPSIDSLTLVRNGFSPYAALEQERKRQEEERKMEEERKKEESIKRFRDKKEARITFFEIKCGVAARERGYYKKK